MAAILTPERHHDHNHQADTQHHRGNKSGALNLLRAPGIALPIPWLQRVALHRPHMPVACASATPADKYHAPHHAQQHGSGFVNPWKPVSLAKIATYDNTHTMSPHTMPVRERAASRRENAGVHPTCTTHRTTAAMQLRLSACANTKTSAAVKEAGKACTRLCQMNRLAVLAAVATVTGSAPPP
eukprot:scaffold706_cov418-Prasinococcus_capsulatus_cf.AAC.15